MGEGGKPTTKSLNKVLSKISKLSGKSGRIKGAYIKSDDFDAMKDYAEGIMKKNNNSDRKPYNIFNNNCGTFACDVLNQDTDINKESPGIIDPRPNSIIDEYRDEFDKVDYNSKDGTTVTSTKSFFEKITDYFQSKPKSDE